MSFEAFARLILESPHIDEKLAASPDERHLGRRQPLAKPSVLPDLPARPSFLRWKESGGQPVPYPKTSALTNPSTRGIVLHFFANHELLAMELMALALLKFPDAPAGFQEGLVRTIAEEQRHLRQYLERMNDLGVAFGDVPVNDFFWRHIASMRTPLDFVVRMSLTFEQANLDFASHYQRLFAELGDQATAGILAAVLADEIGHVRHGLVWFNRWRDDDRPEASEWEAYRDRLPFPLSPSRAKGPVFAADARRQVGFSEDFISRLRLHETSLGRPPTLWIFNPAFEAELLAKSAGYSPKKAVTAIAADLAPLLALLARRHDIVICPRLPSASHRASLASLGVPPIEFVEAPNKGQTLAKLVWHPHLSGLKPWGWSPQAYAKLRPLASRLTATTTEERSWLLQGSYSSNLHARVNSKLWSREVEAACLRELAALSAFTSDDVATWTPCTSLAEVSQAAEALQAQGFSRFVMKAPHGASGRGLFVSDDVCHRERHARLWIESMLARHGTLIVEGWLQKVLDLSLLINLDPETGPSFLGHSYFFTNHEGAYRGHLLGSPKRCLQPDVYAFMRRREAKGQALVDLLPQIALFVANALWREGYRGPAGIDAFIYKQAKEDRFYLRPIVEINARHTMGHIALALNRRISPRSVGLWLQLPLREVNKVLAGQSFTAYAEGLAVTAPPTMLAKNRDLIAEGLIWTSDYRQAEAIITALAVGASRDACLGLLGPLGTHLSAFIRGETPQ